LEKLKKGRRVTVALETPEFRVMKAGREDSFDNWNERRDDLLKGDRGSRAWIDAGYYYGGWYPFGLGYGWYGYPYRSFYRPRGFLGVRLPIGNRRRIGRRR